MPSSSNGRLVVVLLTALTYLPVYGMEFLAAWDPARSWHVACQRGVESLLNEVGRLRSSWTPGLECRLRLPRNLAVYASSQELRPPAEAAFRPVPESQ